MLRLNLTIAPLRKPRVLIVSAFRIYALLPPLQSLIIAYVEFEATKVTLPLFQRQRGILLSSARDLLFGC